MYKKIQIETAFSYTAALGSLARYPWFDAVKISEKIKNELICKYLLRL